MPYRFHVMSHVATTTDIPPPPRLPGWDRPLRFGNVEFASRFTLAPLAGYTNLPYRQSIRDVGGVGLCTTDLVNARAILQGSKRTLELLMTSPEDRPLAVQIYGGTPDDMAAAARWIEDYGATVIDINMGCPVRKVVRGGGGSAMLCDTTGATVDLVATVVAAVRIPVTVKMRLGWDADNLTAPHFAREFERVGVAAVTVHGRTREQGFSGSVNLDGIRAAVEAVERVPVIGNGDVRSIRDADRMLRETGCAGIAIGRGALANPWFFRQLNHWLATGRPGPRGTYGERIDFMLTHFRRLMEWRGEWAACIQFRKMAAWYCKALRAGKATQQILVLLDKPQTLYDIAERLRDQGPPAGWLESDVLDANVHVPAGPISHW
ncbi:MAG TPA: tRNA dihydrouridine synthase DusB [Gemmataceae bacterium]|nr:tRNA dihydrouridine synthase DusB [Gemmataceae bacterium]